MQWEERCKLKSLAELAQIKERMKKNATLRQDKENAAKIVVCMATCGIAAGARTVLNAITTELAKQNVEHVTVSQIGCIGHCAQEPLIDVFVGDKEKVTYVKVSPEKVKRIIAEHIIDGKPVKEYTVGGGQ
jgi:NADP-reducing hydrogenase subunit HndB